MYRDDDAIHYLSLATERIFGDLAENNGLDTIDDLENFFGTEVFWMIYPVMLEFFFTNAYGPECEWNIIDSFLASKKNGLTKTEKNYLTALRPSVMSLYEVTAIEPEKSLTVRDMIRGGEPVEVKEKSLTHYASKWECIGARILDMNGQLEFAGGCLRMERSIAENLAPWLKEMHDMTVKMLTMTDPEIPKEEISHYAEVLWASEIALAWIEWFEKSLNREPPVLYNQEGHELAPVKIRFPVTKDHHDIPEFFNKHSEFDEDGPGEWVWLKKKKGSKSKKTSYMLLGEIILHKDHLDIFVNSRERADILEEMISGKLGPLLGKPKRTYSPAPAASPVSPTSEDTEGEESMEGELSKEEAEDLLLELKDDHYHEWLSMRLPALEDKTPRMARRSKKGRAQLISLLKEMENRENRQAKAQGIKPYDMSWMWKELDLERDAA